MLLDGTGNRKESRRENGLKRDTSRPSDLKYPLAQYKDPKTKRVKLKVDKNQCAV
jgi:hypothetical protein